MLNGRLFLGTIVLSLHLGGTGCRTPSAHDALEDYRRSVEQGDADAIWAMSDESFRRTYTKEELRAHLEATPADREAWLRALGAPAEGEREVHEIRVAGGRVVRLVKEGEGWRVLSGGVEPVKLTTPELALAAFFAAVDSGRLELIRRTMPARLSEGLADDQALRAHLDAARPRIAEARSRLSTAGQLAVEIEGDRARLAYDAGRSVRFVREKGDWKVLDLE